MDKKKDIGTVSIIIPVYNEKNTIIEVIERVKKAEVGSLKKEIIIVDDGSVDGTRQMLEKVNNIKVLFHQGNKGKGAAIQTGLRHTVGNIILIQDADLEYDPEEYQKLLAPIVEKNAAVVYGSRFSFGKIFPENMYYSHCLGNMILTAVTNILYFSTVKDMETGYKMFRREVLEGITLKSQRFDIEPELTAKILKRGIKIEQVPISFKPRGFSEGKKISSKDGLVALWTLIKYRFMD